MAEMKTTQGKMTELLKAMPNTAKAEKREMMALMVKAAEKMKELKTEIGAANDVAWHIQAHFKWKNAIKAVFGDDGVQQCIDWMKQSDKQALTTTRQD